MNDLPNCTSSCMIMKVFERVVLAHVQEQVADYIDPCQFDCFHLEKHGTCIRLMSYDFSSVLNTIQPYLLTCKVMEMNVGACTVLWI